MNKTIRNLALLALLLVFVASCKSQKAVVDATPDEPEVEQPAPKPDPKPEPEPEPKKDVRSAPEPSLDMRLNNYFEAIANASSTDVANRNIREALGLFNSGNAPVLIIFYQANGAEDYANCSRGRHTEGWIRRQSMTRDSTWLRKQRCMRTCLSK